MGGEMIGRAVKCLGRGIDVTRDFRAKYCKGSRSLIVIREETNDLQVLGYGVLPGVSVDIKCGKGERTRYQSDVLEFPQMSELVNRRSSLEGKIPSGQFNSMFGFNGGSWASDAEKTKCLALDGYFISLFNLRIDRPAFALSGEVADAVPSTWDPAGLTRFIESYGTHVVVGVSVGGQDVVVVRQDKSSELLPSEIKENLDSLGDQLFTGACALPSFHFKSKEIRPKVPEAFNIFSSQPLISEGLMSMFSKSSKGVTVTYMKRGGDISLTSHCEWLPTVSSSPEVINFSLLPITSLLKDVPGKGFLSHAINLYLRYKPSITDLECFLEFQNHKAWAPIMNDHPLGPSWIRSRSEPQLQFSLMGPKLRINTAKVVVGRRPVTGMRLHLEGRKNNRLAVHLHHLCKAPSFIKEEGQLLWRSSEDMIMSEGTYDRPVNWKMFSHVSTAPVEYEPDWAGAAAYFVAGAQLHAAVRDSRTVLHLRLLFAELPGYTLRQSTWEKGSSEGSQRLGMFSGFSGSTAMTPPPSPATVVDSAIFPGGPPVPVHAQRLLKFVDTAEISKGPKDSPGFWLVTGAKLALNQSKIGLLVKFSLITPSS